MADRVDQLENEIEAIRKDFSDINATLKELAESKANTLKQRAKASYHEAVDHAQDLWDDVSDRGEEYYQRACGRFSDGLEDLNECVREKPLQTLAIAAGVGFLIGLLTKR